MKWNIGWGLTKACNSRCIHCYNASGIRSNDEVSFNEATLIVDKLAERNVQTINYGTGECGLIDYFWDLVKYVSEKKIIQGLTTNGSTVNEKTISFIVDYMNDIDVSLDYPNQKANNQFRGTPYAWDWVINACELLKKHNVNFSIVTCLHSLNSSTDHIDGFLAFCKKYNCEWRVNWFRPTGRGKTNTTLKLNPDKTHEVFKYILKKSIIKALPDPYFSALLGLNSRKGCPCGKESFRITPSAEVVPCVYFTKEMRNISILEHNFDDVITSDAMNRINQREVSFCKGCEYISSCQGGCASRAYLEYGIMDAPDAFCYKKTAMKENPLKNIDYIYQPDALKVHDNYLCTLIVKAK